MSSSTTTAPGSNQVLTRTSGNPPWMNPPSNGVQLLKGVIIALVVLVMLYPLVYVVAMSFAAPEQARAGVLFPTSFSTSAYASIFTGGAVTRGLFVSGMVTVIGTLLCMAFTTTLAWGLTRTKDVPGSKAVLLIALATMFFGAGIIPNYLLVQSLGLLDTIWALILPGLISAFNMIIVRNFFMNIPIELIEAARLDGASEWRIFLTIAIPLSKAVIAVISLFYAVGLWNVYFAALIYINDPNLYPIQVVLQQTVLAGTEPPAGVTNPNLPPPPALSIQHAVIVVATLPILCVYPFLQRYFTKGVLTGAIKG